MTCPIRWSLRSRAPLLLLAQGRRTRPSPRVPFTRSLAGDRLVKRAIGVGGDTVEGRGGTVYVNGNASRSRTSPRAPARPTSRSR
ncbi:S26 family signal peptidase [Terracoccus luteus]|uniref:S26 family signal peptidase n=1 Tax=Terracoccus luteus TaxID=53356 RepID=UPI00209EE5F1|nr:S26 family signal peptidase [Terracoccus luteus]